LAESDIPDLSTELTSLSKKLDKYKADITAKAEKAEQESLADYDLSMDEEGKTGGQSLMGLSDAQLQDALYLLSVYWIDFHLELAWPEIPEKVPPVVIEPERDSVSGVVENVYRIVDHGNRFSTSRGEDVVRGLSTTGKFLDTVDKMVALAIERSFEREGGEGDEGEGGEGAGEHAPYLEIHIRFEGHELAKRKAFETLAAREENVYVLNYDPEKWGELRLKMIETMTKQGYGVPRPKF
jgi:hypothetical protein